MNSLAPPPQSDTKAKVLPASLRDPSTLFYQSDGIRRRIIFSYWVIILLALPLWWYTTSIERLSLPTSRVYSQAERHLRLPVRICIAQEDSPLAELLQKSMNENIARASERWKGLDVNVSQCGPIVEEDTYRISSSEGEASIEGRQLSVPAQDTSTVPNLADMLSALVVPYTTGSDQEYRVAQYSPRYRLAFSLLNEDAAAGNAVVSWDIRNAIDRHIHPIIDRLSALHNFTIESQIQLQAPLAFKPEFFEGQGYGITPEGLTVFVNSAEWTLSSSASNDPVLHFILFIPSVAQRPLDILYTDGTPSPSNAFLLPQWGGIVINNPPSEDLVSKVELPAADLDRTFAAFSNQLLALLGVPHLPQGVGRSGSEKDTLITEWQLDALLRRRALENAEGAQDTLRSIVKLVDQIENMPVGEDVKGDVQNALTALNEMYDSSSASLSQTFHYSAQALTLASRAFFNPGMLALLYFPAEHKYAVYTPLFASAGIPLFVTALREFLAWRKQRP